MVLKSVVQVRAFKVVIAVVNECRAFNASESAMNSDPVTTGAPVTDVPGYKPRSPVMMVGPVFVTVEAPNTAKGEAKSKLTHEGNVVVDVVVVVVGDVVVVVVVVNESQKLTIKSKSLVVVMAQFPKGMSKTVVPVQFGPR